MRLVIISDTHGGHRQLSVPDGDLLIHAGDVTRHGKLRELDDLNDWLGSLPHTHKVIIAGNHDWCFEKDGANSAENITNAHYLQDSTVTINDLNIYGTPWTPFFFDWAFQKHIGPELSAMWQKIPNDTDILVTHGPPHAILDTTVYGNNAGCPDLAKRIAEVSPKISIFGHIHEAYGQKTVGPTTYYNASMVNLRYQFVHPPFAVDL